MKVMVVGAAGQLGQTTVELWSRDHEVTPCTRADVDLTNHRAVMNFVTAAAPEAIINCASYNDVDGAEQHQGRAFAVNSFAPRTLARAAELADTPRSGVWIEDVNGDGSDEMVLSNGREFAVLTSYGGRLLYWFDLTTGREWVGNQLAVPPGAYNVDVHTPPAPQVRGTIRPSGFQDQLGPAREYVHLASLVGLGQHRGHPRRQCVDFFV